MKLNHILFVSAAAISATSLFASSDTDRKIEDAARASYNYRTVLEDNVKVKASDGVVTLTGVVQEKDLKSLAQDTVDNIPGVVRVDNRITVGSDLKENSDSWMAWKIRYQLLVRADVSSLTTKVMVRDGVAILTGTAANVAERELVEFYAKETEGVKSVKNEIVVSPKTTPTDRAIVSADRSRIDDDSKVDDASITAQVKYSLLRHKSTSALKTKIVTTNGVVAISGVAASDAEKTLTGKLAGTIRGVRSVDNNMTVKS